MSQDYSILPEGYHVAYVSGLDGVYCNTDEHGDQDAGYTRMYVSDADTGKDLFSINEEQGSGDYRGFPACVFAAPFVDSSFFESIASYIWDENSDEPEPTWEDVLDFWQDACDVQIIQFVVRRKHDNEVVHVSEREGVYRYEFVGWLPTDEDFDLDEELENMGVPIERKFSAKVFVTVKATSEQNAEDMIHDAFNGFQLPVEFDSIEED